MENFDFKNLEERFKIFEKDFHSRMSLFLERLPKQIIEIHDHFVKTFDNLSIPVENGIRIINAHSWFPDNKLAFIELIENIKSESDFNEMEPRLMSYFEHRETINRIEESIIQNYPKRAKIISEAFYAHREKKFALSIPVIFSQIDGIVEDKIGRNFFIRNEGRMSTKETANLMETGNKLVDSLLLPLKDPSSINFNKKERSSNFSELNRHMVLHGQSLDYPTKINSLKAISMLNYIDLTFSDLN
jgi:hypothetical protein